MQQGFFKGFGTVTVEKKITKKKGLCGSCKLATTCQSPKLTISGKGGKGILLLMDAPSATEDKRGKLSLGSGSGYVKGLLQEYGIDLEKDCWRDNAVCCHPPKSRDVSDPELNACRDRLLAVIKEYQPEKIFVFGKAANKSLFGYRMAVGPLEKWVGHKIPDQDLKAWVYPMYNPRFVSESKNGAAKVLFERHLKAAVEHDVPFIDYGDEAAKVLCYTDVNSATVALSTLSTCLKVSFDYETTGLKPYKAGHRVVCVSFGISSEQALAMPMFDDKKFQQELKRILISPGICKVAHNIKFEETWSRVISGYGVKGWYWDTMLSAHTIDDRRSTTNLDFQVAVRYGCFGYGKEIDEFKKGSDPKDPHSFNRMDECPLEKLLIYCGMDSLFCYRMSEEQPYEMNKVQAKANNLFLTGAKSFADIELRGIGMDSDYYVKKDVVLQRRINHFRDKVLQTDEVKKYVAVVGSPFNLNSDPQLKKLLYKVHTYKPTKVTDKGNSSVDQEVLKQIGTPFTEDMLSYKHYYSLRNTFLGFMREDVNGFMHPNFNLNINAGFRSSSSNPNYQNIPIRDAEGRELTRSGIIPRPGRQILGADYGGIEVKVSACNHKDPNMIRYIEDPSSDMHRDQAMELFFLTEDEMTNPIRHLGKNDFVFPQFYGDYYARNAKALWMDMEGMKTADGTLLRQHLRRHGVSTYRQFENHVKEVERKFWEEKFPVYAKWKEKIWRKYQKTGYVDLLTGFRCGGLMSKNEVLNRPIQGPAFHCLLWSLNHMEDHLREGKFESIIIGQIHDEMVLDLVPDERGDVCALLRRVMCEDIREEWKWINVPLEVEMDITGVDESWYYKKDIH